MSHYLKHAFMAFTYPATAVVFVLWPQWSFVVALTMIAIYLTFDLGTSPERSTPTYRAPLSRTAILDSYLYLHFIESVPRKWP